MAWAEVGTDEGHTLMLYQPLEITTHFHRAGDVLHRVHLVFLYTHVRSSISGSTLTGGGWERHVITFVSAALR